MIWCFRSFSVSVQSFSFGFHFFSLSIHSVWIFGTRLFPVKYKWLKRWRTKQLSLTQRWIICIQSEWNLIYVESELLWNWNRFYEEQTGKSVWILGISVSGIAFSENWKASWKLENKWKFSEAGKRPLVNRLFLCWRNTPVVWWNYGEGHWVLVLQTAELGGTCWTRGREKGSF